jgi:hypothetical protein
MTPCNASLIVAFTKLTYHRFLLLSHRDRSRDNIGGKDVRRGQWDQDRGGRDRSRDRGSQGSFNKDRDHSGNR